MVDIAVAATLTEGRRTAGYYRGHFAQRLAAQTLELGAQTQQGLTHGVGGKFACARQHSVKLSIELRAQVKHAAQ